MTTTSSTNDTFNNMNCNGGNNNNNDASTPIDLTDVTMEDDDDDDILASVPDSLKTMVAAMNSRLQSEQMDFFSVAVDKHGNSIIMDNNNNNDVEDVDGGGGMMMMMHHHLSPDLLVSPPPNPANLMTESQAKNDLLMFTPKPSLFGEQKQQQQQRSLLASSQQHKQQPELSANELRMDFASPDFFTPQQQQQPSFPTPLLQPPPPAYEPPPPPPAGEMPFGNGGTIMVYNTTFASQFQPPPSPKPPVARAPSPPQWRPQHVRANSGEFGVTNGDVVSTTTTMTNMMMVPPAVNEKLPPQTQLQALETRVRAASPQRSFSPRPPRQPEVMIGGKLLNESSVSSAATISKPPDATTVMTTQTIMIEPPKQQQQKQKQQQTLETRLINDALKFDLPPPTPASTVTGPQPLTTPPRTHQQQPQQQYGNTNYDSPSPLSMSSARLATNEDRPVAVPLSSIRSSSGSSSPPPPRFSPSPIAKSNSSTTNSTSVKFTQESAERLSRPAQKSVVVESSLGIDSGGKAPASNNNNNSGGSKSTRRDALAKMISSTTAAKKSPEATTSTTTTKSLAQRLFAMTRVAPAPPDEKTSSCIAVTPTVRQQQQQQQPLSKNIGELPAKPKPVPPPKPEAATPLPPSEPKRPTTAINVAASAVVVKPPNPASKPSPDKAQKVAKTRAANESRQGHAEKEPARRSSPDAASSREASVPAELKQPIHPLQASPSDNDRAFLPQTIAESSLSTGHFMTSTAVSAARAIHRDPVDTPKASPSDNDHAFLPPAMVEPSSTGHFMTGTAVSAARVIHKETTTTTERVVHVKPLESTSHLLQSTTAAEGRKHRDVVKTDDAFLQKVVSPEKIRPLPSNSHLLQATTSMEARKLASGQWPPAHGSPQPHRVQKLSATSHLLQATAAAEARKTVRKERPMLPVAPPRRVVAGASESLMKRTEANMKKVDEGVEKAKERVRRRMLQEMQRAVPHSSNSSRTSNSSQRSLTIPKSPKFATNSRHPPGPDHHKDKPPQSSLAECDSLFGKSLRSADHSSVNTSFSSRKNPNELTMPVSPMFSTNYRHASKKAKNGAKENDEPILAHSLKVLQQSLRSTAVVLPRKKTQQGGLTQGISPKFATMSHRTRPKSTAELEQEEMEKFQKNPFRAKPCPGITDRPRTAQGATPNFMNPTQGQVMARQSVTATPKNETHPVTQPKPARTVTAPFVSSHGPFRARPVPLSTFKAPSIKPNVHLPTTEVKPFRLQTLARAGDHRHTAMTEVARDRAKARETERELRNQQKEADEVAAIRHKHAMEVRREQEKHSRLVAKLSLHNIPSSLVEEQQQEQQRKRTTPQPFQLSTRHETAREQLLRKQREEDELRRRQAIFRAKPVPKTTYEYQPITPKPLLLEHSAGGGGGSLPAAGHSQVDRNEEEPSTQQLLESRPPVDSVFFSG